ncbi:Nn.00g081440.m01.CDS01 [Neocucurbitaria sp. VM-36]
MAGSKRRSTEQGNRSRSFGGCATCRRRHLKCDETRPTCTLCSDAGLSCGGYEKTVFFGTRNASNGVIRFRRPLLTENERALMSETLTSSIPPTLAMWHIEQIDQRSETASRTEDFEVYHGCFGAFRSAQEQDDPDDEISMIESVEAYWPQELPFPSDDSLFMSDDMALTPRTRALFQSILDDPLPERNQPSSAVDVLDFANDTSRIEETFDVNFPPSAIQQPPQLLLPVQDRYFPMSLAQTTVNDMSHAESPELTRARPSTRAVLPPDAVHLFKHYSATVLKLLTPFKHSKTPWHVLFLPHVKNCLAALTLGEPLDHASLCAFYGVLAVSAFSLHGLSGCVSWLEAGKTYKQLAREHARYMLHTAYDVPKTAKYKSILMALLTMVQVAMTTGDAEQTDCYFLEAEKFIRVKGLNRKKSRKVRLLHHCYAFERMFHESISVAEINSDHRNHVRKTIESSGAAIHSQDSLTFRLSSWENLDEDMMKVKGKEEGENDLHLQLPGIWSATLYPEIFGIPESYIFLLSLIIRLGKLKDAAEHQEDSNTLNLKDFLARAKAVERCIKQLPRFDSGNSSFAVDDSNSLLSTMLRAMQDALAIYFYRRIYDVEASILQPKVEAVRDCLSRFETVASDTPYGAIRLIWPAFIAGCEAEDVSVRNAISGWFDRSAACSGSRLFVETRENMARIWAQKDRLGGSSTSWIDLMKSTT